MKGLKRAAGELALIVLGVLIALTADQWIEERGQRSAEQQALRSLRADLQSEIEYLEQWQTSPVASASFSRVTSALESQVAPSDPALFLRDLFSLGYFQVFARQRATFSDLEGSGRLDLVRSQALRAGLHDYHGFVDATEVQIREYHGQLIRYRSAVHDVVSPAVWAVLVSAIRENRLGFDGSDEVLIQINQTLESRGLVLDWPRIRQSAELRAGLVLVVDNRAMRSGLYASYLRRARELVGLIDSEVEAL